MVTATALMTLKEFAALPDDEGRTELVRGRVIEMPPPGSRHGLVCSRFSRVLGLFVTDRRLGEVLNESGVITHRDPDSVRGPDITFYSAAKLPPLDQWEGYLDVAPDLVVEVRSPTDRWAMMVQKAAEYLAAGVLIVVILDPDTRSAHIFDADRPTRVLGSDDTLTFPGLLEGFAVRVGSIFESDQAPPERTSTTR